ncbi:MAG: hypothetical protein LQ346_002450 [Caloplaca aetnensis]|nr:MAG: hypothetical protein LQ346_002450 [Caloplaca aetnensis]
MTQPTSHDSQMEPQVLYRVCYGSSTPTSLQKSLLTIRPAILHAHCRHRVLDRDYPAIIPSPRDSVRGTYVQGLTSRDIFRLDVFEGDEYERRKVKIRLLDVKGNESGEGNVEGKELEVATYVWVAGEEELEDGEWDFGEFRREKMQRWIGGREEYDGIRRTHLELWWRLILATEVDEAVKACDEDPTGGRGAYGSITDKLQSEQEAEAWKSAT